MDQALMRASMAVALGSIVSAGSLSAQTVRGIVADSATALPLAGVTAELVDSAGRVIGSAVGNDSGQFVVSATDSGSYRLQIRRIGYRTALSGFLPLEPEVDLTVSVTLRALPVELAPVRVEAERDSYLQGRGYYQRKTTERGTFLDPAAVEKKAVKAKLATDILIGIPGVAIYQGAPKLRGCTTPAGNGDSPGAAKIYIDGVLGGPDMMWSLQPNDILAIEVYIGPAQIPLQYGGTSSPCGVLMIWTKH